ncbi:winged helix-turn-helix transcriptional regulator [Croceibacterium xixiisoli]|uniref:winged helix-turn-helix transcriptional regulator n=1 Tax=Croceibacterium xixiisoli TaxID=1476466 RepID=UPI002E25C65A
MSDRHTDVPTNAAIAPQPAPPATPLAEVAPDDSNSCQTVNEVLARIGDKWSMQVVMSLGRGPLRFNELRRRIEGISQRMLTRTLRGLERDGLVSRKVTPSVPPRVDYALSTMGMSLRDPVMALGGWAIEHRHAIAMARSAFDDAQEEG